MKKVILTSMMVLFTIGLSFATDREPSDTTVYFNDKIIHIRDSVDQVSIRVSVLGENGTESFKTVFEGLYTDDKSYERWSVVEDLGIQIPLITSKKVKARQRHEMTPHWAGFGLGFVGVTDGQAYNNVDGVQLDLGRSHEYNYNMIEHITPLFFQLVGLTSGLGMSWRYYYLDNSTYLKEANDQVTVVDASPLEYKYSRLSNWYLTVPLMLELQMFKHAKGKPYLAAGVVGGVRLSTVYKTKYYNTSGSTIKTKDRGMNVPPLTLDYIAQAGYGKVSVYARYSPLSIFETGKGPDVQHTSIGFMLDL
jgi:hypothetical protein